MKKAVLFDLDGTLWDSTPRLVESFRATVAEKWPELSIDMTLERMRSGMGLSRKALADHLFPEAPEDLREPLIAACFDAEVVWLRAHHATAYPHLREALEALSRDYTLGIISNCQGGYIEVFLDTFGMHDLIADHQSFANWKPKWENIRLVMERNGIDRAIYVGDTQGDLDAADGAAIPFVHAAYGFGSVDRDVPVIRSLAELPALAKEMLD